MYGGLGVKAMAVLLPSAAFLITYLYALEVIKYRTGVLLISRRRFRLRTAAWLLVLAICTTAFLGLFVVSRNYALHHPLTVLLLWTGCFLAAIILIGIMYADVKEVEAGVQQREAELWHDFARTLAEKGKCTPPKSPPSQDQPKA